MNWNSVGDFLAMGGYGLYVWGSVVVSGLLLAGEVGALKMRSAGLKKRHARQAGRSRRARKENQ
ncbi:heme exporter protein CcmD [Noviherbaspirillum aridicola]|uniref:Heme exporter protein D n=1 Tax=Noviherbaspirillum aridicola TaxID=2849687 RepID=A0ABQ4Q666_9BURK|nr:heme exporter protein CcmD [Noviherbaspirillum aridicola]GIZ52707.1 hypothetical protein NCCP691_27210 [Noviherbaspirillum aridicola]